MVFSSVEFLFRFLPLFLAAYYGLLAASRAVPDLHQRTRFRMFGRNLVALLGSLWFYAFGAPVFVFVLVGSTLIDHELAKAIERSRASRRRLLLTIGLLLNLGLLLWFKYANFFVAQIDDLLALAGRGPLTWTRIALPIGISFFTFQKISYLVDVYRGTAVPARSHFDALLYVALFPQLIAGPIVRYHDVDRQMRERRESSERFWRGVERFVLGLLKKVMIANTMATLVDPIHAHPVEEVPTAYAWLAAFAYYFQIYFDFSGYSDMAIGLGRMMGFEFLENFDRPYVARTFTEFWRRWHISLSNFMREYLYVPLGGNRVPPLRAYLNLWIVFLVSGFWHGASWSFVVWGAYQGVFLTIDKLGWLRIAPRVPALLLHLQMLLLVLVSWVFFRAETLDQAWALLDRMFTGGGPSPWTSKLTATVELDGRAQAMLAIAALVCFLPWSQRYRDRERRFVAWTRGRGWPVMATLVWIGFLLAAIGVVNSTYNPFIYFRF